MIVGSPEGCLEALLPWRGDLGVNHFVLRAEWAGTPVEDACASIDLLATEVARPSAARDPLLGRWQFWSELTGQNGR